jgi:predicted N-formylglutamate amidohydrolase
MSKPFLVISCEHAGNKIPIKWSRHIKIPKDVLNSHRGIDIGALDLTLALEKVNPQKVFVNDISRLLIELNRSLHHPKLFSEYSQYLSPEDKLEIIQSVYAPYRSQVKGAIIPHYQKGRTIWHISVHSFTPQLNGNVRNAEIGFLYDPKRLSESQFAKAWRDLLKGKLGADYRLRMNYPYLGIADGFVTDLRKSFPDNHYVGIEIEVNQGLYRTSKWHVVRQALQQTLSTLLRRGVESWKD